MQRINGVAEILNDELTKLQTAVIQRHEAHKQVASGRTRASFSIDILKPLHGQFSGANYAGVLERGRKEGKVPYRFWEVIERWAVAKNLVFENERQLKQFAWFVSQKIRKEGTALYRSGQRNDIFDTPFSDFENRLSQRISNLFTTELTNLINIF